MHDQPAYRPLTKSTFFTDARSARPVVEGTIRADNSEPIVLITPDVRARPRHSREHNQRRFNRWANQFGRPRSRWMHAGPLSRPEEVPKLQVRCLPPVFPRIW